MSYKAVIWAECFREEREIAEEMKNLSVPFHFCETPVQEIPSDKVPDRSMLSIRTHSRIPEEIADRIEGIVTRSTGYDHVLQYVDRYPVGYLGAYASQAVADHNLAVSFSLTRKIDQARESAFAFSRGELTGFEVGEMNVGILGVGRIGKATAEKFRALGASVAGHDLEPDREWGEKHGVEFVSLQEVFQRSGLVILCLPYTSGTRMIIQRKHLRSLRSPAFLLNCGRGEVVSNQLLWESLEEGTLGGLGLDVYNREGEVAQMLSDGNGGGTLPPEVKFGAKLVKDPRVIATPHNAFNTRSSLEKKVRRTLENLSRFSSEGEMAYPVPEDG